MGKEIYILLLFCYGSDYSAALPDPCSHFIELVNVSSRSPDNIGGPVVNNDINLAPQWYTAPAGWELLGQDPGRWRTCGTLKPIYRTAVHFGPPGSEMCIRSESDPCSVRTLLQTKMCGKREIYTMYTTQNQSAFCFQCTGRKLDILIISDVSRSISSSTFETMKQFQQALLTSIDISQDTNAVALMEFSRTPRVLIPLHSPSSVREADVLSVINRQDYENGPSTELADALDMAVTEVFTAQKGDRADADNMVILFTDGLLYKSETEDVSAAIGQLSAKAEVLVVASRGVNSVVQEIASEPKDAHIFHLGGQGEVTKIKGKIMPCPLKVTSVKRVQ